MTQQEIIEMARQAGFHEYSFESQIEQFNRFAKLVALRYQKKIADLENIICQRHWDVLQEREACAKVCDVLWIEEGYDADAVACSVAIRARGQ